MKRAIGYIRVSTQRQADSGLGLAAQKASIEAYCKVNGLELIHISRDEACSGGMPIDRRNGFLEAVGMLESGDVLLAAKRDRIARDLFISCIATKLVKSKGAEIATCDGISIQGTAESLLFAQILDCISQFERSQISMRTKNALREAKKQGVVLGRRVGSIEVSTEARELICSLRSQGKTLTAIATQLNEEGVKSPRGGKWHPSSIKNVVDHANS